MTEPNTKNDGGKTSVIEQYIADTLAALTYNSKPVFKKGSADVWKFQFDEGTLEAFERWSPFAFVKSVAPNPEREGSYDLNNKLFFAVVIGITSKAKGDARTGSPSQLGASKISDLVLEALENKFPGTCGRLHFYEEQPEYEAPKAHVFSMIFQTENIIELIET